MCGRMTLTKSGEEIAEYFAQALADLEGAEHAAFRPRYNISPAQEVLTLVPAAGRGADAAAFERRRWGLVPAWAKDPSIGQRTFNARSETAHEKPSFRAAWKRRRCVVVADGFYEWTPRNRGHRPFHFRSPEAPLLGFAGLYENWQGGAEAAASDETRIASCTILTARANADLEGVHHRMPVVLSREDFAAWLGLETPPGRIAELAVSAPAGTLERREVSRYVNDARHEGPECLRPEPVAEQGALFALDPDPPGRGSSIDEEEEF